MRSLPQLQALAAEHDAPAELIASGRREDLMDFIRDALGGFDPDVQLDPAKAQDLKRKLLTGTADPYAAVAEKYFNTDWVMEPKLDGARMRLFLGDTKNTMNTGRRSDKTYAYIQREDNFPHIRDAVDPELAGTILDGEIMAPSAEITTASGVKTNSLLNATVALTNCNPADSIATQKREGLVVFHVFDVLMYKGEGVTGKSYDERREILESVTRKIWASQHSTSVWLKLVKQMPACRESIAEAVKAGYEGVMLKLRTAEYKAGKRMAAWQKIKLFGTLDAFVTGWLPGEGKNAGKVGALKMSLFDEIGLEVEVCQHGAFTDEYRNSISKPDGSLADGVLGQVMEITGQGVTKQGRIRHPHLVRLRPDKTKVECTLDQLNALPRV
jgi:ATP-dependent DNA ligase